MNIPTHLLKQFESIIKIAMDEEGVNPSQGVSLTGTRLTLISFSGDGSNIIKMLRNNQADYLIIGVDAYPKAGDDIETESFLQVFSYSKESGLMFGVMEYEYKDETPLLREIKWGHPFSNHYAALISDINARIRKQ